MARAPKPWFREDRQSYFVTIDGVRHNLGPDKAEADRRFHLLMAGQTAPPPVAASAPQPQPQPSPAGLTVAEVFDKFLDWCQSHRSPRTFAWSKGHIQAFCDHLPSALIPVTALRPYHVAEWVDGKPTWGANQKRGAIVAVTRPFNWAAKMGYIDASPVRGVEKPQPAKRESRLTAADFDRLLGFVADQPFRDLLVFAYEAGVRPQEARHVEARHVRLDRHRVEIPPEEAKGKRRWRVIYLSGTAEAILTRLSAEHPSGKLFRNTDGNPWAAQAVVSRFQRLLVKMTGADAKFPPLPRFDRRKYADPATLAAARRDHAKRLAERRKERAAHARGSQERYAMYDLRHLFATRKLREGTDPITVAALLGHKDAAMLCKHYEELSRDGDHLLRAVNPRG